MKIWIIIIKNYTGEGESYAQTSIGGCYSNYEDAGAFINNGKWNAYREAEIEEQEVK